MRNRDIKNKSMFNSIPRDGDKHNLISNWKKLYAKKPKFSASVPAAAAAIVASFVPSVPVFALPEGLTVKQGNLTTQTSDNTLTINQGSNRAFGDWNSFDIQSNETVNINQPTVDSIMVGRVTGGSRTEIFGNLNATGGVILINPKGMLFGAEAEINTASFSASTLDIKPLDFSNANDVILNNYDTNSLDSSIINFGSISVSESGLVSLIAPQVVNEGVISAKLGKVQLASGTSATLDLSGDGLLNIALDENAAGIIKNTGTIEGQNIRIGGGVATSFVNATVNIDGFVQATGFDQDSSVDIQSSGDVYVDGIISSSESDTTNNGGSIKVLGDRIAIKDGASISSSGSNGGGEILIGGNYLGRGPEPNASATVILKGAEITADALNSGDGGRVIVWSDDYTNFAGLITAKGSDTGIGGFVETSSKDNLQAFGNVDASGGISGGTWLLDPSDVTITSSATSNASGSNTFEPTATTANINVSSINTALSNNQNVIVTTALGAAGSGQDGDITVSAAISGSNSIARSLRLVATDKININSNITATDGALNIGIRAEGDVTIGDNVTITTRGGTLNVSGANNTADLFSTLNDSAGSYTQSTSATIDTSGPNNTAGGAVTIKTAARDPGSGTTTNANIVIGGDITTSGGTSTSGGGYAGGAVTITATGAGTISVSANADITTTGSAANSGDNAGGAGGNVTLDNAGTTLTLNDTLISTAGGTGAGSGAVGNGGNITISDPLTIASGEVQLNTGTGSTAGDLSTNTIDGSTSLNLTYGGGSLSTGIIGGGTALTGITYTGTALTLSNNITTNNGAVDINAPVTLGADITITTQNGSIDFSSAIDGNQSLTLSSGSGAIALQGATGENTALTALTINSAGTGTIEVANIGDGTGAGVSGATAIGNTSTTTLTLDGTVYKTTGAQVYTATAGDNIDITNTSNVAFTTSNTAITFGTANIELADGVDLILDSSDGAGDITLVSIDGHSSEAVTIDAGTGTTSVGAIGAGSEIGAVSIGSSDNGTITLNGAITTTGAVSLDGPVSLATGAITVDSSAGNGAISFLHTIDGAQNLTLSSGSGAVDVNGIIGSTTAIGTLTVNASGTGTIAIEQIGDGDPASGSLGATIGNTGTTSVTFDGTEYTMNGATTVTAQSGDSIIFSGGGATTFTTSNDAITFGTGTVQLSDAADLTITSANGAVSVASVGGTSSEDITINAGTGTLAVGAIGNADEINTVTLTGSTITLSGDITTSNAANNNIDINGAVVISGTVDIDTDTAGTDGTIDFSSTIDGAGGTDNLSIQSGTGALTLTGSIGVGTSLDTLNINTDAGTAAITIAGLGDTGNAGAITTNIGNSTTSNMTFGGTYFRTSGDLTVTTASGAGKIDFTGAAPVITTGGNAVSFVGGSVLLADGADLTINTNISNSASNGGNISIAGAIAGTSDEDLTLTTGTAGTGTVSVHAIGAGDEISTISIRGNTKIELDGDIKTSEAAGTGGNAPSLTFTGPVELISNIAITTDTGGVDGIVSFSGAVDAEVAGTETLTIDSGTAATTISGAVGATNELGGLTINSDNADTGAITLTGIGTGTAASGTGAAAVTVGSTGTTTLTLAGATYNIDGNAAFESVSGANKILITGTNPVFTLHDDTIDFLSGGMNLADGANLTVNSQGGAIQIVGAVTGTSAENITLNSGATGTATVAVGTIGASNQIHAIDITGTDGVTLNGNITTDDTASASVSITGPVTLGGDITIDTQGTNNDGTITFASSATINGAQTLTLDSGTGAIALQGKIGDSAALSGLVINTSDGAANAGTIEIFDIGDDNPATGVTGTVSIGNTHTASLTLDGTNYDTTGATVYEAAAGSNSILITGADVSITTANNNLTFDGGNIVLSTAGTTTISTGTGGGALQIDGTIDGTSSQAENLTITTGSGSATIGGTIGGTTPLTTISVNASGSGAIDLAGIGDSDTVGTTGGGTATVGHTSTTTLTLSGSFYSTDGAQSYTAVTGGGNIDITGSSAAFTTTGDNVAFNTSGVDLANDGTTTINTGTGNGDVTFGAALESTDAENDDILTITSGAGDVTFTGAIGATNELGGLNVNASAGAGDITFSSTIGDTNGTRAGVIGTSNIGNTNTNNIAFSSTLYSFDGTTTFESASGEKFNLASAATIETAGDTLSFTGGTINLADGANLTMTTTGGAITVNGVVGNSSETVSISAGSGNTATETVNITGDIGNANEILSVAITAQDGITLTGVTIDTADAADPNISFTGPVTVSGTVVVTADNTNNDGTVGFSSTIDGAGGTDNLSIQSGAGALTLTGSIGVGTSLDTLNINTDAGTAAITIAGLGDTGNAGAITTNIGNSTTSNMTFGGTYFRTSGDLTVTTASGAGKIDFTGAAPVITTGGNAVSFVGGSVLLADGADLTINTNISNSASNGGNISIAGAIAGTSDEDLTLTTGTAGTGTVSVHAIGAGDEISTISIRGNTKIELDGDIKTSEAAGTGGNAPSLTFTGPVELISNIAITTDTGGVDGIVSFSGAVDAEVAGTETLTIDSGTAATTISGAVGATNELGGLTINSDNADTGAITLTGIGTGTAASGTGAAAVTVGSTGTTTLTLAGATYNIDGNAAFESVSGANKILITGTNPVFTLHDDTIDFLSGGMNLADGANLTVNSQGGAIQIVGAVTGTSAENITLNSGATGTATVAVGTIGASNQIHAIDITGTDGVTLNGNITTDDTASASVSITGPVTLGGDITIDTQGTNNDGTITFASSATINGAQTLTLDSGTGAIALQGKIGDSAALSGLVINTSDGAANAGTIEIFDIGDDNPATGVTGTVSIGNTHTASLTLDGTNYDTTGATVYEAAAGSNSILITGADVSITTANNNLTFDGGNIVLSTAGTTTISTGTGGGALQIDGTIDGTSSQAENLTITTGSGSATIGGTIGGTTPLTTISVNASGSGAIDLAGIGDSDTVGTTGGGTATVGHTSTTTLTLSGSFYSTDGAQSYTAVTGGGNIDITGSSAAFTTTGDNVAFNTSGVDLANDGTTTINTGTGNGDVTFGAALESTDAENDDILTITSGAGDVTFTGAIGATNELGGLNVNASAGAGDITFSSTIGDTNGTRAGVIGTSNIGNTNTNNIAFSSTLYSFDGTTTFESASGEKFNLASAATIETAGDTLSFTGGTINLADGANLTMTTTGGAITVNGVVGNSSETVSISAGSGNTATETVNITGDIGNANEILSVAITAQDGITLTGVTIDTADAADPNISFTGPVTVSGTVVVTADNTNNDGTVGFSSTIDGAGGTDNLSIQSGAGALTLTGSIGVGTSLDTLNINTDAGTAAITIAGLGDTGNAGAITTNIGNSTTSNMTFGGTYFRTSGDLTVTTASGAGKIDFTGAAPVITTGGNAVSFVGGSVLLADGADLTINTNISNSASNGGNISIAGAIAGTSDEDLTLTTGTAGTGTVSVHAIGAGDEISTISIRGNTKIELDGDIKTSEAAGTGGNAPSLTFTGPVELISNIAITTDTGGVDGIVSFSGAVDAEVAGTETLTIDSGTAATTISGAVGATNELGGLTINSDNADTGAITLTGIGTGTAASGTGAAAVTVGSTGTTTLTLAGGTYNIDGNAAFESVSGANKILITGTNPVFTLHDDTIDFLSGGMNLADGANLTVNSQGGAIQIVGAVTGTSAENITLNSGATGTATVAVGTIGASNQIHAIDITGTDGVTLNGNITTDDTASASVSITGPVTLGGDITIDTQGTNNDGTITFASSATINGAQTLTLDSGTGAIALQGKIGDSAALAGLVINTSDGAANAGTIEIFDIGDDNPATGVTGTVSIGNTHTASLTLDGTNYDTTGATVYEAAAGSNSILITGADVSITTANNNLTFDGGNIVLSTAGTTTISTGTGGGALQIDGTIDGTSSQAENLTITTGSGSATIGGTIGGTTPLTTISVNASGSGAIDLAGIGDSDTVGTTGGGTATVGHTSTTTLTLSGSFYSTDGAQSYTAVTGGGNIDITGSSAAFTTTGDNVAFNTSGVDLANDGTTTINTGTGNGDVTFGAALESTDAENDDILTITSGAGDVTFTGAIGATNELGGLNVNASAGAGDITFSSTIGDTNGTRAGVIGTSNIGNTNTNNIAFSSTLYSFDGTTTFESASGEKFNLASAATIETAGDTLSFTGGTINLADGANLTMTTTGGAITVNGVVGNSSETVSISAGSGNTATETVNITGDIGNANEILSVAITAQDGITLTGVTIDTADAADPNISFTGPVTVSGTVVVTADNTNNDGTVGFSSTIDGAGGTDNLSIQSGAGALTLTGSIGVGTSLDTLNINTDAGTAAITIAGLGDTGNAGAITTNIGNSTTSNMTFGGTYFRTSGDLTVTTASGAGKIDFTGAAPVITTGGNAVSFVGGSVLLADGADLTINTNISNSASNGGNISIAGAIAGTSDEDLTLTTGTAGTGTVSVHAIGAGDEISTISIRGNTKIELDGDIKTSEAAGTGGNAPSLTFTGPVELISNIAITTDTGGVDGIVSFSGAVDAEVAGTETLTIDSGTAATTISGAVGATNELGGLTINSDNADTGAITLTGIGTGTAASGTGAAAVTVGSTGTTTLTLAGGTYNIDGNAAFESVSGANKILITGTNPVFTLHDDTIDFLSGGMNLADGANLTVNSQGGAIQIVGAVTGTSAENITLNSGATGTATVAVGTIGASNQIHAIDITGTDGVTLNGNITTDDTASASVSITGPVTLGGDITIDTQGTNNDGTITFASSATINGAQTLTLDSGTGAIALQGKIGDSAALAGLVINTSDGAANAGTIEIFDIGDDNPATGVTGTVSIGNTHTASLTLDGTNYDTTGATVYEAAAGSNSILITGADVSITTANNNLTFDGGNIVLSTAGTTTISTGTGGGALQIDGTIDGTSSQAENLTITTGSGSATIGGTIGGTTPLTTISVNASGSGAIDLAGIGDSDTVGTTGGGTATVGHTSTTTLTLSGSFYSTDGAQSYTAVTGGGNIDITGSSAAFTTTGDNVAFNTSGVDLANDGTTTINTGTGNGDVTFGAALDTNGGNNDALTISSGSGAVEISGTIGNSNALAALTINAASANDTSSGTIKISNIGGASAGITGATNIGNTNTPNDGFELDGSTYNTDGSQTYTAAINGIFLDGSGTTTFTTSGDDFTVTGSRFDLSKDGEPSAVINTAGGNVSLAQGVRGHANNDITINAGSGTISVGEIGAGNEINTVSLTSSTSITLGGSITTSDQSGNSVTLAGPVIIDGTVVIDTDNDSNDGAIDFSTNTINAESNGTDRLTVTSGGGTITMGGIVGGTAPLDRFIVNADALTIAANITTDNGLIDINAPVTISGTTVAINSGTGTGNIEFSSTIDASEIRTKNLDILSGTGTVTISGNVGASARFQTFDINNVSGNTGAITLSGDIGAGTGGSGSIAIGNSSVGSITFAGDVYKTTGSATYDAAAFVMSGTDPIFSANESDTIRFNTGNITLATVSDLTIRTTDTGAGNSSAIIVQGDIAGTSDDSTTTVTMNAGTGTVAVAGMGTDIGNVTIDGSGGITLNGSITTAGGNIDINDATTLGADSTLTTANGTVDFASTIDGAKNFDISSGSGSVNIVGDIGAGTPLTTLDINATGGSGAIEINDVGTSSAAGVTGLTRLGTTASTGTFTMDGTNYNFGGGFTIGPNYTMTSNPSSFTTVGDVNFLGTVQVDGTFSIDSGGGDITIAGNITSTGEDEIISLTDGTAGDGSGTITLGGTVSASNITLVGDSGIVLSGDITSNNTGSAGAIAFTGPITLADTSSDSVTIDADQHADTTVTFNSTATVNAATSGGQSLVIDTDAGAIAMQGAIGGSTALSALTVNADGAGTIEIANIGTSSAAGVTGATAIGNTSTGTLTLDGSAYTTTGTQTYKGASGGSNIVISGTAPTFTTTNTAIAFNTSDVTLSNNGTTTINTGSGAGGVTFGAKVETNGGGNDNLTITSGEGNVTFTGSVGAGNSLGALSVNASSGDGDITFSSTIGDSDSAGTSGTTAIGNDATEVIYFNNTLYSFDGGQTTITAKDGLNTRVSQADTTIKVNGEALRFDESALSLSSGANLTINSNGGAITAEKRIRNDAGSATLTINAGTTSGSTDTVSLAGIGFGDAMGAVDITAADGITLSGGVHTIGSVRFRSPLTISGDIYVDTVEDSANTSDTDGAVTFDGTVDGTGNLWILTGSGAVTFSDAIGATTPLTGLAINTGADHTGSSIGNGIKEGVTVSIANIGTSSAAGVSGATLIGNSETGTVVNLTGTVYNTNALTLEAATGGNININASNSAVTFTTSGDAVNFNTSGVDLANDATTTINTGTGAGTVTFQGAIETDGGNDDILTVTSGTGNVTFTGALGATEELGGLNVNSSAGDGDITFTSTIGDSDNAGIIGTTAIGNDTTADLNFNSTIYSFDGTTTITAASGDTIDIGSPATFQTAADDITFATGNIELADGSNLTVDTGATGGNIIIGEIGGTSVETVTLDAGTGTTSVGVIGSGTEIGTLSIGSAENGGITLNGAITTDGVVTLDGPITLATAAITITTADDNINLQGTVDGGKALTLASGSGAVTVDGAIGSSTALTSLTVNSSGAGTIEINNIGTSSAAGVTGATAIGNTNTGTLTLDGTVYTTNASTYTAATGENIDLTGAATTTFTSSNDDITFGTATVEMANGSNLVIDTDTLGGAIDLSAGVMGTSSENITLTAGTGTVAIGAVGTGTEIADVSITSSGDTTISGDFTGGSLTNSGPAIVSSDINLSTTGNTDFGSTLDSSNGNQTITFVTAADITITGAVGGTNPFSTFTITDADNFTYSGGGSIAGFSSGKFSRTGGFAIFNPGPSIDNINTVEKAQDKEIAFFDAPVFKLFNSFLAPTVTDLIKEKAPTPKDLPETVVTDQARSNSQFLEKKSSLETDIKDAEIKVDFLDGDILIIDKSLEVVTNEFESLDTINDILDELLIDDSSELSINSTGKELFKISSNNEIDDNSVLEDLLISFSNNEDLNQGKSFIF